MRRFPASRKHPQFNGDVMRAALEREGIAYEHLPELGGRRTARKDSENTAWRSAAFRGYADYMETPAFAAGIEHLSLLAGAKRTAVMCAEALWWRCHRGLISDLMKSRGTRVLHITDGSEAEEHPYTAAASLENGKLSYRGVQPRLRLD